MREVFADTFYWVALFDPRDPWHAPAADQGRSLGSTPLLTTEMVLVEVLNYFACYGD